MVAQIDEEQLAVVALAMHPAGEPHPAPGIGEPKRAAGMGPINMHLQTIRCGAARETEHGMEPRRLSRRAPRRRGNADAGRADGLPLAGSADMVAFGAAPIGRGFH